LLTFLTRRSEGLLMRRFQLGQEQAGTLRRWTNASGLLALLLLTLNLAQIPLTVFAFAGGALAIGIGFGTQTLIKNLISGMIVLVERNIRVGDIIEVEGVTGTVTAVDVRSSTLRGFDGVESMIPNAMLLEQKVTNWTLTSAKLRRVVKVGVAYGSPLRDAARILAQCVERHDAVLKDPAPQVLFEDFGDDACILCAYFWIDLTPSVSAPLVMSEIRFQVEEEFAKAGIGIAFPQRDVHLDAAQPLRVEVVSAAAGGAAA
jgi:small-conductance mechanosensitive channel